VPLQFARPADQRAASFLSGQLADLRKKERLRELYRQQPSVADAAGLMTVAETLAPVVGLDLQTALGYLMEFTGE